METPHTVFFNNRKILFLSEPAKDTDHKRFQPGCIISTVVSRSVFIEFIGSDDQTLVFAGDDPSLLFRQFAKLFLFAEAAGGLVAGPGDKWLFIYRNDRWDLPKGHIEKGEMPEEAAIREAEEECGIKDLEITGDLPHTHHVYPYDENQWVLKRTHWFMMKTDSLTTNPQFIEGITRAEWKHPDHLSGVLQNTYGSIRELLLTCQMQRNQNK